MVIEAASGFVEQQRETVSVRLPAREQALTLFCKPNAQFQDRRRRDRREARNNRAAPAAALSATSRRTAPGRRNASLTKLPRLWRWPPTRTLSSTVMRPNSSKVLESAADADSGDTVRRDIEQAAPPRTGCRRSPACRAAGSRQFQIKVVLLARHHSARSIPTIGAGKHRRTRHRCATTPPEAHGNIAQCQQCPPEAWPSVLGLCGVRHQG